ncbi:MAG: chorismate-binding protein [Actinobacteria bacterium]|nr:chorismate-binding protein [Actinomycetota bacterium]
MTRSAPPRLVVETREIDSIEDLLEYADPHHPLAWLRRGEGIVAVGDQPVIQLVVPAGSAPDGMTRNERFATNWREIAAHAVIDDDVELPGTGLIGFGALTFDDRSAVQSTITVPAAIVGRRGGRSWLTRIRVDGSDLADPSIEIARYGPYWAGTLGPGALGPTGYQDAVRHALAAIEAGDVSKVVLARDLQGTVPAGADLRRLARALSSGYPDTWTFAVDGLIGASPETLVTVAGGTITARVLAGTTARGADADADTAASLALSTSAKDLDEHQYAVQSVLAALRPKTSALAASEQPFALKLPNVWHLATDVEGELDNGASALDLVGVLHPTAAVAGSPTDAAIEVIRRLEPFDRGRYAGPVGWVDGNGDGEWAIALRCAQFGTEPTRSFAEYSDTIPVTAYAGAGIVAGSDPESELMETRVKFRPIVDALA